MPFLSMYSASTLPMHSMVMVPFGFATLTTRVGHCRLELDPLNEVRLGEGLLGIEDVRWQSAFRLFAGGPSRYTCGRSPERVKTGLLLPPCCPELAAGIAEAQ